MAVHTLCRWVIGVLQAAVVATQAQKRKRVSEVVLCAASKNYFVQHRTNQSTSEFKQASGKQL